jgi:biopolymer transport protein ExbD
MVFGIPAYADNSVQHAVDQFCDLYNPKTWEHLGPDADVQTIYADIVKRQKILVRNPKVLNVIALSNSEDFSKFYFSVKQKIESLLGKPWACKHFDNFYMPSQLVIPLTLGKAVETRIDPNADNVIIIMLSYTGDILINNAPLVSYDAQIIEHGIMTKLGKRDIRDVQFILYLDEGADGNRLAKLLVTLSNMDIDKVQLIDY